MVVKILILALPALLLLPQETPVETGLCPSRPLRPSSDPLLAPLLERYRTPEPEFRWQIRPTADKEKVTVSWLTFPSSVRTPHEENNTVWARLWQPKGPERRRPAVVLLHWLGGSFHAFELVGHALAEQGIVALMMYMPYYGPRQPKGQDRKSLFLESDLEGMAATIRQAVLDVRRAGDWLAARSDVEPSRVGVVGVSLGAIVGSLAAGVDDRFGRSVFVIGGGDLAGIIMHGSKETVLQKRKIEGTGIGLERLRELWREVDPCTFAGRLRPEEVLMINAEKDEVVPRSCTLRLHEAAGRPELRWIKGGHYAVALHLGAIIRDITRHVSARTAY